MANFCLLLDSCVFINSRVAKLQTKLIFYRSRVLTKESKQHSCDGRTLPIRQAEQMLDMPDPRVTSSVVVALFGLKSSLAPNSLMSVSWCIHSLPTKGKSNQPGWVFLGIMGQWRTNYQMVNLQCLQRNSVQRQEVVVVRMKIKSCRAW